MRAFLIAGFLFWSSISSAACEGVSASSGASVRLKSNKGEVVINGVPRLGYLTAGNGSCDLYPTAPMFRYHKVGNYIALFDCVQGEPIYTRLSYVRCS